MTIGTDLTSLREFPSSHEAERGILGGYLLDPQKINNTIDKISAQDFYFSQHKNIFTAIKTLYDESRFIDIITIEDVMVKLGTLQESGGREYLILLQENLTIISHIEKYIEIVKEKSLLRGIIQHASNLIMQCYDQNDQGIAVIVDKAEKMLYDIANKKKQGGFLQLDIWLKQTFESLVKANTEFGNITGVTSGYFMLDELTNGFQRGDFIVLAARPSMGKTAFSLCLARNAALNGIGVGFVSLEMSADQLVLRILSFDAKIKLFSLRSGKLSSDEWLNITNAASRISAMKIYIDDMPSQNILDIRTKARKLKMEHNIQILIVDYLQLLSTHKKYEGRHHEVSEISRFLKSLAKELNIPVIALSQLSRGVESRIDKRPILSDLRDSGAIEQDADLILFLYRDIVYNQETEDPESTEVIIAKQRNGPTGTVKLKYKKEYTLFEDYIENMPGDIINKKTNDYGNKFY